MLVVTQHANKEGGGRATARGMYTYIGVEVINVQLRLARRYIAATYGTTFGTEKVEPQRALRGVLLRLPTRQQAAVWSFVCV